MLIRSISTLSEPFPEDLDLLREVDFVLSEIRRSYMELDKFWTEEIRCAVKALNTRRLDLDDVERWRGFKANLEKNIESWKVMVPRFGSMQRAHQIFQTTGNKQGISIWSISHKHSPGSSVRLFALPHCVMLLSLAQAADLGAIASSLSPALSMLKEALHRVQESASVESSPTGLALVLRTNLGLTENNELCLGFFRRCVDFGDMTVAFSDAIIAYPAFSRVRGSNDLQERVMALQTEAARVPAELIAQHQGLSPFFMSMAFDTSS